MATHFPTSHDGLDRVIDGATTAKSVFSDIFSAKRLPTYVLGITIMAVVTATERALDAVETGFAFEWAILTVVALTLRPACPRDHTQYPRQTGVDGKLRQTGAADSLRRQSLGHGLPRPARDERNSRGARSR